jgi:GTP-binding protein EngB required for normal cell division
VVVVLTKADKLGRGAQQKAVMEMKARLGSLPVLQVLACSSRARSGRDELLGFLGAWLKKGNAR